VYYSLESALSLLVSSCDVCLAAAGFHDAIWMCVTMPTRGLSLPITACRVHNPWHSH
jgi:hypothetical protein